MEVRWEYGGVSVDFKYLIPESAEQAVLLNTGIDLTGLMVCNFVNNWKSWI